MFTAAIVSLSVLVVLAIPQAILILVVPWAMRKETKVLDGDACPRAAVVLCVRGNDPFLSQCIQGLLTQDYPNYELHIVVDHQQDSAWPLIDEAVQESSFFDVDVEFLKEHRETCSLKCSSLVQAIEGLNESHEVIAFLDADVIPHRSWLRELVTPLVQEDCSASMGYRWRTPHPPTIGSLVRYVWSAQNTVQQYWARGIWGGCWAIKHVVLRELDVVDRWTQTFVEDALVTEELVKRKHRVAMVPSLAMVSSEASELGDVYRWIRRLLFTTRIYISGWIVIVIHALVSTSALIGAAVIAIASTIQSDWISVAISISGLAVYLIANAAPLAMLDIQVRAIVRQRGEKVNRLGIAGQLNLLVALAMTQVVYVLALIACHFVSIVSWRGIRYEVNGPFRVRMCEYNPFVDDEEDRGQSIQSVF